MIKWILFFLPFFAFTKDFGHMGQTFPIEEKSILEVLQQTLSQKEVDQKIIQAKEKLLVKAKTPAPISRIQSARKSRSFLIDLSYTAEKDIQNQKGEVIVKAGSRVNPLAKINLSSGLLFLDGDQEEHLIWARKQEGNFKWILVKGKPIEIEEREKRPVYFDQAGFYTSRFKVENVPAKVIQKGERLLIQEIALGE